MAGFDEKKNKGQFESVELDSIKVEIDGVDDSKGHYDAVNRDSQIHSPAPAFGSTG